MRGSSSAIRMRLIGVLRRSSGRRVPGMSRREGGAAAGLAAPARRCRRGPRRSLARWPGPRPGAVGVARRPRPRAKRSKIRSRSSAATPAPVSRDPEARRGRPRARPPSSMVSPAGGVRDGVVRPGSCIAWVSRWRSADDDARRRRRSSRPVAVAERCAPWRRSSSVSRSEVDRLARRRKSGRSALASSSRSSTKRLMRSSSSVHERQGLGALLGVVVRAAPGGPRTIVIGVRSSWPASSTKSPLGGERPLEAVEHGVERPGQLGDLVVALGLRCAGRGRSR